MKYIAILALAAAFTGPAVAGSPTEPVQVNSQREYIAHQIRCAGLLFDDAEHARICGTMEGNNFNSIASGGGGIIYERPVLTEEQVAY
jgi:hypothetical protein